MSEEDNGGDGEQDLGSLPEEDRQQIEDELDSQWEDLSDEEQQSILSDNEAESWDDLTLEEKNNALGGTGDDGAPEEYTEDDLDAVWIDELSEDERQSILEDIDAETWDDLSPDEKQQALVDAGHIEPPTGSDGEDGEDGGQEEPDNIPDDEPGPGLGDEDEAAEALEYIEDVFGDTEPSEMTIADIQLRGIFTVEETGSGYTEEYKAERARESGGEDTVDEPPAAELTIEAWGTEGDWQGINQLRERREPFPVSVGPFVFEQMGITSAEQKIEGVFGPTARMMTIELQEFREHVVQERSIGGSGGGSSDGDAGSGGTAQGPEGGNTEYSGTPETVSGTLTEQVGGGEVHGGELYDVSASGANVHINAQGSDWLIENVGLRGQWTGRSMNNGDTFINATVNGGSAAIRHIYMADGANGTNRDTGIWYDVASTGDLEMRRINAQGWPDNAMYASPPHESGGNNPNVIIADSYSANNQTSCYRMARGTISNCVGVRDGNGTRGNRVVWCRNPGTVELENCQFANRQGNGYAVKVGNGGSSSCNARGDTVIEGREDGVNFSGGATSGTADVEAYDNRIPGSPDEAAEGTSSGGGGE